MKNIRILAAVALGIMVAFGNTAIAQNAKGRGKRDGAAALERQMEQINRSANLTEAQKPKVKAVLEKSIKERQEVLAKTPATERGEKMRALQEKEQKELKAILTPEQMDKVKKDREERRGKGKGMGQGAPRKKAN